MMLSRVRFVAVLMAVFALVGCDQMQGSGGVVVMDVRAVAQATGQDEDIQVKASEFRDNLMLQLQQLAADLDGQLNAERAKAGEKPTAEVTQRLQQMNMQARQQIGEAQQLAQQQATEMETNLVLEFRDALLPIVEKIAASKKARVVLSEDAYVFWSDDAVDITDEVIAAWSAANPEAAAPEAAAPAAAVPAAPAAPATAPAAPAAPAVPAAAPGDSGAAPAESIAPPAAE
jgi:Skp family chaperone for outer membrane proteins